ncbi:fe2+ zn2+ uptake regulation protein [Pseudomonas sp. MDT1-85]
MYNHSVSSPLVMPMQPQPATARQALQCDRNTNTRIRELLRFYGLRTSLIRLKVIDALLVAAREERSVGVHGVHAYLCTLAAELSFISVREVLKRLCEEEVIHFQDKSYSFTAEAWALLKLHSEGGIK